MGKEKVTVYILDIRIPKEDARRIQIEDGQMTIGSDQSCDIQIHDQELAPLQGRFRYQNDVLTLTQFGPEENAKLGRQKLKAGKMYIIDKGDKITFHDVKIIVRQDKVVREIEEEEIEEEESDIEVGALEEVEDISDEDSTDPGLGPLNEIPDDDDEYEYVEEEVVYVQEDEDGDEVPSSKTSFFSKIKNIFKGGKKDIVENQEGKRSPLLPRGGKRPQIKVKKGKKVWPPVPGFLIRLIALCFELLWTVGISTFVLKELKFEEHFAKYQAQIQKFLVPQMTQGWKFLLNQIKLMKLPVEAKYLNLANKYFLDFTTNETLWKFLLVFLAVGFISHLLFATSLPLFLMGVGEKGNFFFSRIKGLIRFPIGLITAPFVIFDLPCVIKKRSLKEVLTFSHLYVRKKFLPFFGVLILLPLISVSMFLFPIGLDYQSYMNVVVSSPMTPVKKSKSSGINNETAFVSNTMEIKAKTFINKYWYLIPEMNKGKKKGTIDLKIVDTKRSKTISLSMLAPKKLKSLDHLAENPVLQIMSPEFTEYLQKEKDYPLLNKEVISVIKSALTLSLPELHLFLMKEGPMVKPYMNLRKEVLGWLKLDEITQLDHLNFMRKEWLSIKAGTTQYLVTSEEKSLIGWKLQGKALAQMGTKTLSSLFANAKKLKASEINDLNQVESFDAFSTMDAFSTLIEMGSLNAQISQKTVKFFMKLSLEAIETDNDFLQSELANTLKALDRSLIQTYKLHSSKVVEDLRIAFNRLSKALKEKDLAFIKLNLQDRPEAPKKLESKPKKSATKSKKKKRKK